MGFVVNKVVMGWVSTGVSDPLPILIPKSAAHSLFILSTKLKPIVSVLKMSLNNHPNTSQQENWRCLLPPLSPNYSRFLLYVLSRVLVTIDGVWIGE
jgi:hypothetical protein